MLGSSQRGFKRLGQWHRCQRPAERQIKSCPAAWVDLLAPSGVSQGDLPRLSPQLPLFRTRATTPAMPSILMPSLVLALAGELRGTSTRLWSGIPSLRGEKASGEPNSLYLWITTAAFNSLE